jgi:hypothetical protein
MTTGTLVAGPLSKIGRTELAQIPVPQATATHRPVPHHEIVEALVETLSFRHIAVVNEEYAASNDGMKMFGVLDLETQMEGCRFSIGIRNSHDKSLRLGLTAGIRVFVCSNMAFSGDFTPVLAKHSKSFNLIDTLAVGVDRIQRNFEPMQRQVEHWRQAQVTDERAKLIFYAAFVDGKLDAPKSLLPEVHRLYFEPQYEEFSPRTMELVECFHKRVQEARSDSTVQGDGKTGRISQSIAWMIPAVPFTVATPGAGSAVLRCHRIWSTQPPRSPFLANHQT